MFYSFIYINKFKYTSDACGGSRDNIKNKMHFDYVYIYIAIIVLYQ